jgi:voltage-gated potassium channel
MTAYRKLIAPLAGLALITALGTLGYVLVEGMSVADALFMTVITISTVGYGEVQPLSPAGRIFTVGLILIAVGLVFYLLTRVAEILVQGSFRELYTRNAMQNKIDQLSGHVIICGYGRLGRIVAEELERAGTPQVIVEIDVTKEPELQRAELPYLIGSALSDDVIERAGIARASSIVAATRSDSDNVFITLSAREHSADIRIHARGESDGALRRLKLAGADTVMSAYQMGGMRLASSILRPTVVDFLEISRPRFHAEVDLEEIRVEENSKMVGQEVGALEEQGPRLRIVALKRGEEDIELVPTVERTIGAGDHLVVIGERAALDRLAQLAAATS